MKVNITYSAKKDEKTFLYRNEIQRIDASDPRRGAVEIRHVWHDGSSQWISLDDPIEILGSPETRVLMFLTTAKENGFKITELSVEPGDYPIFEKLQTYLENPMLKMFLGMR